MTIGSDYGIHHDTMGEVMISAVILTHNSSQSIKHAAQSVSWCREIVVIDDNSTDETRTIAKKAGFRIHTRSLNNDFALQRNFALTKVLGPWVLYLDSDEVISPALRDEILGVCGKEKGIAGYSFKRRDIALGTEMKWGETSRVEVLRLALKDKGSWVGPVHEVWDVRGAVKKLRNPILHYSHRNVAQFLDKINTYSTIRAEYLHDRGVKADWWDVLLYPTAKFIKNYFLYQGFRDGTAGFIHAMMMSFHSFQTRAKLWHLRDKDLSHR